MRQTIVFATLNRFTPWLLAMLLAGCAITNAPGSITTGMSAANALASAGEPSLKMPLQGGERWFYVQGWYDMRTIAVDMEGTERRIARIVPALTETHINQIQPGMAADAVSFLIGPPYRQVVFQRLGATAWDYRFRDTWGYMVELSVMVDAQNRVVGKVLQRIEPVDRD